MAEVLTKADIIQGIARQNGCTKCQAADLVNSILHTIKTTLAAGEDVMITGFGKFRVRNTPAKKGRNPMTGEPKLIEPRRVVTFKCSEKLRARINGG